MADPDFWMSMAAKWGVPETSLVDAINGDQISALRWQHNLPEFPASSLPHHSIFVSMQNNVSHRLGGGRLYEANGAPGSIGLQPAGLDAGWTFGTSIDVVHIVIPQRLISNLAEQSGIDPAIEVQDRLKLDDGLLENIAAEVVAAMSHGEAAKLYVDTLGSAIAMRVIREYSSVSRAPTSQSGGLASWQLKRVTEYVEANLSRDISLAELAALAGLSSFHFCRAFKKSQGLPPHQWHRRLRLRRAQELLRSSRCTVGEVAALIGFRAPSHLARAFRQEFGVTPASFRRSLGVADRSLS